MKRVVIFSRDELKQFHMSTISKNEFPQIRFFIGMLEIEVDYLEL